MQVNSHKHIKGFDDNDMFQMTGTNLMKILVPSIAEIFLGGHKSVIFYKEKYNMASSHLP